MDRDPRELLRAWLPHVLLLALLLAACGCLLAIILPIWRAVLMGAALTMLTTPVLFDPIDRLLLRLLPRWPEALRRYGASLVATVVLVAIVLLGALVLLYALIGDARSVLRDALGLAFQDPRAVSQVVDALARRTGALLALYPSLGVSPADVRATLQGFLVHARFGPEFVKLVFTGTGGLVVEIVFTFTTTFYLYTQGPLLAGFVLRHLPLSRELTLELRQRFARTVTHLLAETVGKALAIGIAMGALAWLVAGFNPVLVGVVGIFAGLLPVVGHAFIWLPLASLLLSQHEYLAAGLISAACWAASWLIEYGFRRLAQAQGTDASWLSFLLFCSVVGGVIGAGVRGLVLGPAAVIATVVLLEVVGSLYAPQAVTSTERLTRDDSKGN